MNAPWRVDFNWKTPNYDPVFLDRMQRLERIRKQPRILPALKAYYREDPVQFIDDWGCTFDPRNVPRGLPATVPFILFPKQREWLQTVLESIKNEEPLLTEKSRESGVSWLGVALACTLCIFNDGFVFGFGSRKQEYVDKADDPKSLFFKARMFMNELPVEFKGSFDVTRHAPHMRIIFPDSGSRITGESGDEIGRGDRSAAYLVDESAFLERPQRVEAALSQTTRCRIDVSTPNGLGNPFEQKRHSGRVKVFTFHWRDDPRKDEEWYAKQKRELDPVVIAQEIDIDYAASVEGVVIPGAWVRAAVNSRKKIKAKYGVEIKLTGSKSASFDVADEGKDQNAVIGRHGVSAIHAEEFSGKGSDIMFSTERAFTFCDTMGINLLKYDADGVGADVRGNARVINEKRLLAKGPTIEVVPYRSSAKVRAPERDDVVPGRKNEDYFGNRKAQAHWEVRVKFLLTYRWVEEGVACDPDDIIDIPDTLACFTKLVSELSQPTYAQNNAGKMIINKKPDGAKSPNLGDAFIMEFCRSETTALKISPQLLGRLAQIGRARQMRRR